MKIKFGTTSNNRFRAMLLGNIAGMGLGYIALQIQRVLDDSHKSRLHSSTSNVTAIKMGLCCGISYDDCLCSVQRTQNELVKDCLTDNFLLGSRILPPVLFILQICLIRDLFTFTGKYTRFVIYGLWITVVFIFVIITDGIYRNSCFHRFINILLFGTGGFLFILVVFDLLSYGDIGRSSYNHHTTFDCHSTSNDQIPEEINNESVSGLDLL